MMSTKRIVYASNKNDITIIRNQIDELRNQTKKLVQPLSECI